MEKARKGKVYLFEQNNSFGYFDINDTLCPRVYIAAKNAKEANKKAESIGIYFNGVSDDVDCPCCGDRWHPVDEDDIYQQYPNYKYDFDWCNYVIFYDEDMKPKKIYKRSFGNE